MPKPPATDIREDLIRYMSTSMQVYLDELTKRYFQDPSAADSRQLMLESLAIALTRLTHNEPHAKAVLAAFAVELQDLQEKQ